MNEFGQRVLIVEGEPGVRRFLRSLLPAHGYPVCEAAIGEEALVLVAGQRPDVVVLDLGLSDWDGVQLTRALRKLTDAPILVLSARGEEGETVAALEAGADDYLTKPFGSKELLARLHTVLRRSAPESVEAVFLERDLRVDFVRRVVALSGNPLPLAPNEYALFRILALNAGKVVTHRQLLREIWGLGYEEEMHLLRVTISDLRHKLERDPTRPRFIVTEPGVGYRLRAEFEAPKQEEGKILTLR